MASNGMMNGEEGRELPQPNTNVPGHGTGPQVLSTTAHLEVMCGPLLNYRRMSGEHSENPVWHGSVMIVTTPGQRPGSLTLTSKAMNGDGRSFEATKLYEDPRKGFWRWEISVPFLDEEMEWTYSIPDLAPAPQGLTGGLGGANMSKPMRFFVPSKHESFRIMFHSCNGFSVGTDRDVWKGPTLWNDVLRVHTETPMHVMIGGGDQIYNDSVRVDGPLKPWTAIGNPHKRREFPFDEEMRAKCDQYYFENYTRWYSTEPFHTANGQIPQVNIWDDHDIIDGFGSYTDHFMRCSVFRGIGGVAHKYYMLFQHHLPPPASTYTTNTPGTGQPKDAKQLESTFVAKITEEDPSYIIGPKNGPYVEERSRNMYCQLGKRIAFAGLDARTERTRHQINYPETYDKFFKHIAAKVHESRGQLRHLVLLLGVPIAYPRLQWLENILQSPLIAPIKFLNKRFGVAGGLFNQFDGAVDLVDDLDDHYTAHQHKKERKQLIHRLQDLAKEHSMRITILGGDVHLAALGRFYSNPDLNIPADKDWRYMANIVSSAIVNKPPPPAVANLLAKRNKIHHLDHETDETLLELFNEQPGMGQEGFKAKSAANNHATMPSRNYAVITESHSHNAQNGHLTNGSAVPNGAEETPFPLPDNPRQPIHRGEENAGTKHNAAGAITKTGLCGIDGLDVSIRVENSSLDTTGSTTGYGFSIPALDCGAYATRGKEW